jgi:hypothetical protein
VIVKQNKKKNLLTTTSGVNPELDSGWRLGGVGVHRIVQPTNDGTVHHRQAFVIKNCMRLRQLFLRHAHLLVVCMMRPKYCLADQGPPYGVHKRVGNDIRAA